MLREITWPGRGRPGTYRQQLAGRDILLSFFLNTEGLPVPLESVPPNIPLADLDVMLRNLEEEIENLL